MTFAVRGTILQTPGPDHLEVLEDHVVIADGTGVIESVLPASSHDGPVDLRLESGEYLLPGLIDLHVHAPQWPQLGVGLDKPLEDWLFAYTFPLEARYADDEFAAAVWPSLVTSLLRGGTTTAVYFSSIHEGATAALARTCLDAGQRAFVGRVAMDHPDGTPEWYRDADASSGVAASRRSIAQIEALDPSGLVRPIITPRFIPACTDALLEGLGELASATGVPIQTHCSEGDWEHQHVLERCGVTDTVALDRFGLLQNRTVLAHADHITDDDRAVLAERPAGLAHCPLSNSYFANAVLPVRTTLDAGVTIGLGTDIAGGSHPGLLSQCAHAVTVSRMLEDGVDPRLDAERRGRPHSRIDLTTAFHLATVGGAETLGIAAGLLEPGRMFDAFTVRTGPESSVRVWPEIDDDERVFEKIVRLATPADVTSVWVNARHVITRADD